MSPQYKHIHLSAFAKDAASGNPASLVIMSPEAEVDLHAHEDKMQIIAQNLNQPMTSFLKQREDGKYDVRWFTPLHEVPLCGHATLVAGHVLCTQPGTPVEFVTHSGATIAAEKTASGSIAIQLPAAEMEDVPAAELEALKKVVAKAVNGNIVTAKRGLNAFTAYLLVELDVADLEKSQVHTDALRASGYKINIFTTPGIDKYTFASRMFAPTVNIPEDWVCGSAHSLLAPYWSAKAKFGNELVLARAASARGGDLTVSVDQGVVTLEGAVVLLGEGEIHVS